MGLTLNARGPHVNCHYKNREFVIIKTANLGVLDREFRGKEQLSKPRI